MPDERTRVVREYVDSVFRRGRVPMEPVGFSPDWEDQPSRHKTYPTATRFPLPPGTGLPMADASEVLLGGGPKDAGPPWTTEDLAALLRLSYGVLDRRLRVSWNQDSAVRALYPEALWGRGTGSGGGMYPMEIYWVTAGTGGLAPGVYHYSTAHHALERLLTGDLTEEVRAACGPSSPGADPEADGFLLVTVRFWKNAFKYNSFCYHVVSQDAGALLGCWDLLAAGLGRRLSRAYWFDDQRLARLLGLDAEEETVLAVVPLPTGAAGPGRPAAVPAADPGALIDRTPFERSARVRTFEQVEQVHRAVLADRRERPAQEAARDLVPPPPSGGPWVELPEPLVERTAGRGIGEVMRARRTSFGSLVRSPQLGLDELGTVLAGTVSAQRYTADVVPEDTALTGLYVLANRVAGLASGCYRYDPEGHRLHTVAQRPLGDFLQRNYYLSNYNLEQAAAVLAISGRWESTLEAMGSRGYRVLSAEVGAMSQSAYATSTALGTGCGVVLGFDNISIDEAVGLDGTDERTFLFVLLGQERADRADFDYRLV
ncbi:SagB family peptide dehydrogenase [Streptomyces palmae]|uniref:SagB/ThcOx family dehydrogenase n=1 Tax=Streptomyces palmae TaxID=1701085 RepID=A0A4Z0HBN6_9ACTN|nr:SagB family peptide dehydrogenase [Streptomyces palmae]TGB16629.1 SagB/ThcOx family dehydrogenase [Streptomyces palmae]